MTRHIWVDDHIKELGSALTAYRRDAGLVERWGHRLAEVLAAGGRLLAAGNGGSAAEAQHLTAELVGRFVHERRPLSAVCLSAETSSLTAIVNDYGPEQMFARQVYAHGRPGDVLFLLSASGRSGNILAAARTGLDAGLHVWAVTGPRPNPLAELAHQTLAVPARSVAVVQEVTLVALHTMCAAVDARLPLTETRNRPRVELNV